MNALSCSFALLENVPDTISPLILAGGVCLQKKPDWVKDLAILERLSEQQRQRIQDSGGAFIPNTTVWGWETRTEKCRATYCLCQSRLVDDLLFGRSICDDAPLFSRSRNMVLPTISTKKQTYLWVWRSSKMWQYPKHGKNTSVSIESTRCFTD